MNTITLLRIDRWPLAALLLLAAVVLAPGLGWREPMPPDEPRFALMARDMVDSGDWLFPRRGTELYAHKPPMFMWLQAATYKMTGSLGVAFLLPSLLAALATLALVWDLSRRVWGRRFAGWAALALLTTLQFVLQARRGQIDAVVTAMITASMYGLIRHHLLGHRYGWAALGWFMAGLGTITKGVGFLPLLALVPICWARRRGWRHIAPRTERPPWPGLGPIAFVLAATIWLAPMLTVVLSRDDPALNGYAHDLLFRQTATRYANPWHHHQPPWYFAQVIASLWLPFALALPGLIPAWRRRLKRRDARMLILVGWSALVLLFFSATPGKREVYILPALPMLCVAAAPFLPGLLQRRWLRVALLAFVVTLSLAALYAGATVLMADPAWVHRVLENRGLDTLPAILPVALTGLGAFGLLSATIGRLRGAAPSGLGFVCALSLVYGGAIMPALSESSSAQALMRRVGERIGPDAELGLIAWREQHLLQADRPAITFGYERPLAAQWQDAGAWLKAAPERRWLFVQDDAVPDCLAADAITEAGTANRRQFVLIPGTALPERCDLSKPISSVTDGQDQPFRSSE